MRPKLEVCTKESSYLILIEPVLYCMDLLVVVEVLTSCILEAASTASTVYSLPLPVYSMKLTVN